MAELDVPRDSFPYVEGECPNCGTEFRRSAPPPLDAETLRQAMESHAAGHKYLSRSHVRAQCAEAIIAEYVRLRDGLEEEPSRG